MSLKTWVERIFAINSNYLHVDQAFNQASSLQALSDDLYTDPFRFIYELIQNADDASCKHLRIALIEKDYLILSHNGNKFDEKDLHSLCAVNKSTKIRNSQTAGYKGLGFKAIFGKSNYVLIATDGKYFRFDKEFEFTWTWTDIDQQTWERNNEQQFIHPWQICPIWTEQQQIPKPIHTWLSKNRMPVNIIIRLNNVEETRNALEELAAQPHTFLFLRHIRQVEFVGISMISTIRLEKKSDGSMKLFYDKNECSQWLISRQQIKIPLEALQDKRLPEKLRQVRSTEIGLAAKIDPNNVRTFVSDLKNDSVLFAYMPTRISTYNLPLLINANFLTNANREQIHTDSVWNQWLFDCIPRETIEWVKELVRTSNWTNTAYNLLPMLTRGKDILAKKYNDSCSLALTNTKFICNYTRTDYLTLREAVIDVTRLSNQSYIGTNLIFQYLIKQYSFHSIDASFDPFVPDNERLRELGVRIFDWEDAIHMFNSNEFQESFSVDRDLKLISYLFDRRADEEISKLILRIPFIMDRNRQLRTPTCIYFPSDLVDVSWHSSDGQEAYVYCDLMKALQPQHRQWLEKLGVTTKTELTFFFRTIIPQASTFITSDNALQTIQRLFILYSKGHISADHLKCLGNLSLLTAGNTLVPANRLYLSSSYEPRLALETVLPKMTYLFVSSLYLQDTLRMQWKNFFLFLDVREDIGLTLLDDNCKFLTDYHTDQMKIIFGLHSQPVHRYEYRTTLNFLELTYDNYHFACFFWSLVLQRTPVRRLNQPEKAYWGAKNKPGAKDGTEVYTFPQWFVRTRSCIPVSISLAKGKYKEQCLKAVEVFTGHLRPLIGHYLPLFDYPPNLVHSTAEWENFFHFKTEVTIDNFLYILEQIWIQNQSGIDGEDDTRVQNIYAALLTKLSEIDQNSRESYREKCRTMKLCLLSALNNHFIPAEELNFWSINTYPVPSQLHTLKLNTQFRQDPGLSHLLYVLNINQIQKHNLNLIPLNANPCDELTNRLHKSSLLVLLDFYKFERKDTLDRLDNIRFLEADRLELNIDNPNIFVSHAQVYSKINCFYVAKPWNSPSVLNELVKTICEFLDLPIDSFETHIRTVLTNSSIDQYFIQLGIHPTNENSTTHNNQFTSLIERTNLDLFKQIRDLPTSYTPAELLIVGLETQSPSWTGYIYHYTHLENAASILRDQSLKSRHLCQTNTFKDSSSYDFMSQTDDQVNHYVRFYFHPKTSTQRDNENLGSEKSKKRTSSTPMCPVPIFFCIKLEEVLKITNLQWKLSLSDMSKKSTEYDCTLDTIKRFDFCGLFKNLDTEHGKHSAQLEFLIKGQLDFQLLPKDAIRLVCQNSAAETSLECMLKEQSMQLYPLEINQTYFFGENNRIFINHDSDQPYISVLFEKETHGKGGMFIVQIKSDPVEEKIDLACHGNICATFHHNHITTIYGKGKKLDVLVGKQLYTVYYKYEQQLWLIYTNHSQSDFDDSHIKKYSEFEPYD